MGLTSENVAKRYGVTRQEQDQAAVSSIDMLICCHLLKQEVFENNLNLSS